MKKITTLLFASIIGLSAFAQKQDTVIFKKAEKLIIKNSHIEAENFTMAGKALLANNFMIASKDEQFGQLVSEPIKVGGVQQVIFIVVKDNEIVLTSKSKANSKIQLVSWVKTDAAFKPITYSPQSMQDDLYFDNMRKIAKSIGATKVIYSE